VNQATICLKKTVKLHPKHVQFALQLNANSVRILRLFSKFTVVFVAN